MVPVHNPLISLTTCGTAVRSDDTVATDGTSSSTSNTATTAAASAATTAETTNSHSCTDVLASPAVRRFARSNGIDIGAVKPTGSHKQITMDDVHAYISAGIQPTSRIPASHQHRRLRGVQLSMAKRVQLSLQVPTLVFSDVYTVDALIQARSTMLAHAQQFHVDSNITFTSLLVKALSMALRQHPHINSIADPDGLGYTQVDTHDISIAIDTLQGLVVPTLTNAQDATLLHIQRELVRLRDLAYNNQLSVESLQGGTITVSNLGTIGGRTFKALLVPPQLAIVAFGSFYSSHTNQTSVDVSITADHRFLDGAAIARFSNTLRSIIENPI
uniref:Lipoamide acyltransferase component of branched-chain alpha-keto acid dehydrogenase complex, mitochondrial n=1 Tax=Lygus hesperus TaxID=30085 RepID=A0A0A9XI83_LYGHE